MSDASRNLPWGFEGRVCGSELGDWMLSPDCPRVELAGVAHRRVRGASAGSFNIRGGINTHGLSDEAIERAAQARGIVVALAADRPRLRHEAHIHRACTP